MTHTRATLALLLCLAGLAACAAEEGPESPELLGSPDSPAAQVDPSAAPSVTPHAALAPPVDYETVPGERERAGTVELAPAPESHARVLRRMSVKQLRQAILNATGGLLWRDASGRDMLEVLEPTLGVPTYIDTTNEDLDASLVFQKFLGDGVRSICEEAIAIDLESAPADRVMIRHVAPDVFWETASTSDREAIDANLRYMKLRITGHHVEPESEEMSRLRWLFRSVTHATGEPSKGWRAVCVGLMSSPEFYLY